MSPITFTGSILVRDNLEILGLVGERNLSQIVTTYGVDRLQALYIFEENSQIAHDLVVSGLVTGFNVTDWRIRSLRTQSELPQIIPNKFKVNGTITYLDDTNGDGLVGEIDVRRLADSLDQQQHERLTVEQGLIVIP